MKCQSIKQVLRHPRGRADGVLNTAQDTRVVFLVKESATADTMHNSPSSSPPLRHLAEGRGIRGRTLIKFKSGFTLMELLVVVSVLGIILGIVVSNFNGARVKARDVKRQVELKQIQLALERYFNRNGIYPSGCWLNVENTGSDYIPGLSPDFISKLPLDPLHGQATCPNDMGGGPPPYQPSNKRYYYYCGRGGGIDYKVSVCSESLVSSDSPWYDPMRIGYAFMVCSGGSACTEL